MRKTEDIVCYDFQGWPEYKMNLREILLALGGQQDGNFINGGLYQGIFTLIPSINALIITTLQVVVKRKRRKPHLARLFQYMQQIPCIVKHPWSPSLIQCHRNLQPHIHIGRITDAKRDNPFPTSVILGRPHIHPRKAKFPVMVLRKLLVRLHTVQITVIQLPV